MSFFGIYVKSLTKIKIMKNLAVILPKNYELVEFILNRLRDTNSSLVPNVEIDRESLLAKWKRTNLWYLFFHKNNPCELIELPFKGVEYLEEDGIDIWYAEDVFNLP